MRLYEDVSPKRENAAWRRSPASGTIAMRQGNHGAPHGAHNTGTAADAAGVQNDAIRLALRDGGFRTHYQPIVRLADGRVASLEVLARLPDPVHGDISPDVFVPEIEAAGLSAELLKAVLASGLPEVKEMAGLGQALRAAFNLPLELLLAPRTFAWMEAQRRRRGLEASQLTIELTETTPVDDLNALARAMRPWVEAGYDLMIDDVTPDMPNHREMLALPFTSAKLDRSVTRASATDPAAFRFIASYVEAARAAGKRVVAEGVESPADWRRMRALGVDFAQGFLISRAMPSMDVPAWVHAWDESLPPMVHPA